MASRKEMSRSRDKKVFRNTAVSSKKINIRRPNYRGGIRF